MDLFSFVSFGEFRCFYSGYIYHIMFLCVCCLMALPGCASKCCKGFIAYVGNLYISKIYHYVLYIYHLLSYDLLLNEKSSNSFYRRPLCKIIYLPQIPPRIIDMRWFLMYFFTCARCALLGLFILFPRYHFLSSAFFNFEERRFCLGGKWCANQVFRYILYFCPCILFVSILFYFTMFP